MNVKKSFKKSAPKAGYSYSQAKKGKMFPRQADKYANSKAPVLTSDLLRDFSLVRTSAGGFEIGWVTHGAKIKWLKKRGRVLTDSKQAFPKGIVEYMSKELTKQYKKENPNKTTIHNLGKK
tara:strand:- start:309 stop:671 length:363 start_codon:yes stop_codon:yes gene_type:complete